MLKKQVCFKTYFSTDLESLDSVNNQFEFVQQNCFMRFSRVAE